jgi:hypothetical protein
VLFRSPNRPKHSPKGDGKEQRNTKGKGKRIRQEEDSPREIGGYFFARKFRPTQTNTNSVVAVAVVGCRCRCRMKFIRRKIIRWEGRIGLTFSLFSGRLMPRKLKYAQVPKPYEIHTVIERRR